LLCRWYQLALLAFVITVLLLLRWSWENGGHPKASPQQSRTGLKLPVESQTLDGPGRWGMIVTLLANGALYMSLLFGWFYLWTAAPQWAAPDEGPLSVWWLLACGIPACLGGWLFHQLCQRLAEQDDSRLQQKLWFSAALGLLHVMMLLSLFIAVPLDYTGSAHDAVLMVILLYLLGHAALTVILTGLQALRVGRGYVSAGLPYEPQVIKPLWFYYLAVYWLSVALFFILPLGWGSQL
jgi:cytochrome c oxidase subunit I+III